MKSSAIALLLGLSVSSLVFGQEKDYPIQPLSFTKVQLEDTFWLPRIETNRTVTIPASFARCENTGRINNFRMAAAKKGKFCTVFPFDDTDIYKTIEGASYSLALHPDEKLGNYVDSLITTVKNAQEPDGYLYTARTIDPLHPHKWAGAERWVEENNMSHELYNSGHLFEAAAAHYQATGKRNLLDIALFNADLLVQTFGPGKRHVAPGHEIVEMGLVRLYRITGKQDYLQLAKFFIDERGKRKYDKSSSDVWKNGSYFQDDAPVTAQDQAEGHAVRAMYLYSGMADVAALTGDQAYIEAIDRIWNNMVAKKIYVQGGIGAVPNGERFGGDYDLPNATAYNETCAAIGNVYWNHRMFLLHGDSKYADVMEKVLYNGLISGVGLDGKSFFYTNALQVTKGFTHKDLEAGRSGWFECSCCPTNIARFLPSLPGYMYAQRDQDIYINLYISGTADLQIAGRPVKIEQQNDYPWNGLLTFHVIPQAEQQFTLRFRLPGWTKNEAIPSDLYSFKKASNKPVVIKVNGQPVKYQTEAGYALISRTWKPNDLVQMDLHMEVRQVVASRNLKDNIGKSALQRGPLVYCAEWKDNGGRVSNLQLPANAVFKAQFEPDLLGGVNVLKGKAFTAIPYYGWANRGEGEMTVWFPSAAGTKKISK
ncbi:glycoside hydrolase family 127 protein [Pedobacter sp. MC2016-15]|uniref:glycoside hydrolase family 127 protein n=1 Tax=Pedobacter sp. MC2016-15 TaxID=2994473 RepID=UPI0022460807|nr:glycoside hydrolase family 127 protein [Pedobacter sp. MC2016-15]MCX2480004.1 glycoside hydrolase family 127 protein [Pedobacter sp. MC2016-15]